MNKLLPLPVLASVDTPQGKRQRREQLSTFINSIRDAEFPRDYQRFAPVVAALRNETEAGRRVQSHWFKHFAQGGKVPDTCSPSIFLPLLQADLAHTRNRHLEKLTDGLRSPKREQAAIEPVPATAAGLRAEAIQEQAQAIAKLIDSLGDIRAYAEFAAAKNRPSQPRPKQIDAARRQKRAQHKQDYTPVKPCNCLWSQPMTQSDYVNATARNRKTIARFLKSINARPMIHGHHAAEADRYSVAVNLKVLARLIGFWADKQHASGLAAAAIVYAHVHDHPFTGKVSHTVIAALESRKLLNAGFADDIEAHKRLYSRAAPYDSFLQSTQKLVPSA